MSDLIRIGLVAEGVTDYVVIHAAIQGMLGNQAYELKLLQPESSVAFVGAGNAGPLGGGWKGVASWCNLVRQRNGRLENDIVLDTYDLVILHLDADVADEDDSAKGLPCSQHCPPSSATTDPLRTVFLSWLNEQSLPDRALFCTPSKSTEAWVMEALFPNDREWKKTRECLPKPETRLAQQPVKHRIRKSEIDYRKHAPRLSAEWQRVANNLSEAGRFDRDFRELARSK